MADLTFPHISDKRYVIYEEGQTIEFDTPAVFDSISILNISTNISTELTYGIEWSYSSTDVDKNTISQLKLYDPSFNKLVLKSLKINKAPNPQFTISVGYDSTEPELISLNLDETRTLEFTPELLAKMLEDIQYLKYIREPVNDYFSDSIDNINILEEDINKTNPNNYIVNETRTIDVPIGKMFIYPSGGAFFKDSVSVVQVNNNKTLTYGTDYVVIGCDLSKTAITSNESGVFNYIHILAPIVGDVDISYHAFGGLVTPQDLTEVKTTITDLVQYLNKNIFITDDTIGGTDYIQKQNQRITLLEESMRRLTVSGRPTYADKTNRTCVVKKITSPDNELHWWNIASLYQVDGSTDIITCDRGIYRIRSVYSDMMMDVACSTNLKGDNKFSVNMISDLMPKGFVDFTNYDNVEKRLIPQFRVIWNDNPSLNSGVYLQIGLALKGVLNETIVIEDLSGDESCWLLTPEQDDSILPQDDTLILPDTVSIWDTDNSVSVFASDTIDLKQGHLVWAGSIELSGIEAEGRNLNHLMDDVSIGHIKEFQFDIYDRKKGEYIGVKSTHPYINHSTRKGNVIFYPKDFCALNYHVTDVDGTITFSMFSNMGTNSEMNKRFELRQILAYF